jgi:(p)ppGpp synthase/HD superfamily hydrolase
MDKMIHRAISFATDAHAGQVRKYTGDPYIEHPLSVMAILQSVNADEELLIAAVLHDVVEDTPVELETVEAVFGERVAQLVDDLTDRSRPDDGNRRVRKQIDLEHTAQASPDAKTIKLADLIDNTGNIVQHDPGFAKRYMKEKQNLLQVLTEGHPELWSRANAIVEGYYRND